jgi:hypothetical protein
MIRAALVTALLTLALSAPAFGAEEPNHPFERVVIGGVKDPSAKPPEAKLESPCGVAVNLSGTVFVSDYNRQSILGFTKPLPPEPNNGPCALAAAPLDLYVAYWHGGVFNPATETIDPRIATGIAVDPESFDLYINHRDSVAVYTAPVSPGDAPSLEIDAGPGGALEDSYGVAISKYIATYGFIYVADAASNTVKVFDPTVSLTAPVKTIDGANTAAGRFVSLEDSTLAIDQSNGHLFVVDNTQPGFEHPRAAVSEYNDEGVFRGELQYPLVFGQPTGITVNESITPANGDVYVTSGNGSSAVVTPTTGVPESEMGSLLSFGPAGRGKVLEASVSGTGTGSVKSSPAGIACPGACKAELNEGATILLTATPGPGSEFASWSGACTGNGPCSVTLNAASSVNAEFVPAPVALSASARGATAADVGQTAPGGREGLRLGRSTPRGPGSVLLHGTAPGPGVLTAAATGVRTVRASVAAAGTISIRLQLRRAGRIALSRSRRGRVAMPVEIYFAPSDGGPGSAIKRTVTFR